MLKLAKNGAGGAERINGGAVVKEFGGSMQFEIEAQPKPSGKRTFAARYRVEAETAQAAVEEALRRFRKNNPSRSVAGSTFKVVRC